MTLHLSIVADVFRNESQAKHAIEDLRRAGFAYDQIGIAMRGHEGIDLQSDLQNLGVSHEHASFYVQEVKAGYTVVSVRPDGREQEAHEIMRRSGAFTDANSADAQTSTVDKQRAVGDQAAASYPTYSTEQPASSMQEDFYRPRSLKPREERVPVSTQYMPAEGAALLSEQKSSAASLVQQDDITEKKPRSSAPVVQNVEVTQQKPDITSAVQSTKVGGQFPLVEEQKPSIAPVTQNDAAREQLSLTEDEHRETTPIDNEEKLRSLRNNAQGNTEVIPPQPEKYRNTTLMKNGVLLGGVLLGLGAGVLVVLLRREQIRQFVLSVARTVKTQRTSITMRNSDN